jgi:hypothetical protein
MKSLFIKKKKNILQIDAAIMYCTENPFITPLSLSPKWKSTTISQARKQKIWTIRGSNVMAIGGGFVERFRWEWGKKLRAGTKGSYLNTKDSIPEIPTKHKTRTMMPFFEFDV